MGIHSGIAELPARCVIERSPIAIVLADATADDQPIVFANAAFERLTGYPADAVIGRNCRFLQGPETDPAAVETLRTRIAAGEDVQVVLRNYRMDGSAFWNEVQVSRIRCGDDNDIYVGMQREVSVPPRPFERGNSDLKLREMQHRVKNHLQMIVSLIRLQSRKEDAEGRLSYRDLAQRIENLQLLYEQLSRSGGDDERVDLGAYVTQIVAAMTHLHANGTVRMNVEAAPCPVSVDLAVQIGLVLSEMVTNALQHAFEGREGGLVEVRLLDIGGGRMRLRVCDDGIGIPGDLEWPSKRGMGGQLIVGLVEGAQGVLVVERTGEGTTFLVDFARDV